MSRVGWQNKPVIQCMRTFSCVSLVMCMLDLSMYACSLGREMWALPGVRAVELVTQHMSHTITIAMATLRIAHKKESETSKLKIQ